MDTDDNVVEARGVLGVVWRGAEGGKWGDNCNSVNNKKKEKQKSSLSLGSIYSLQMPVQSGPFPPPCPPVCPLPAAWQFWGLLTGCTLPLLHTWEFPSLQASWASQTSPSY